jgi:hypothetical protein
MFHTHQAYAVEDLNMTLLLVTSLLPDARDYDVALIHWRGPVRAPPMDPPVQHSPPPSPLRLLHRPFFSLFQDILLNMGEVAKSPKFANLMIQQESFSACLSGQNSIGDVTLITDRPKILSLMSQTPPTDAILTAIQLLVSHLPSVTPQTFPTPLSVLAWLVE